MLVIVCVRATDAILAIYVILMAGSGPGLIEWLGMLIWTAIQIVGLVFMAFCVALIGNAEGERLVFGRRVVSNSRPFHHSVKHHTSSRC